MSAVAQGANWVIANFGPGSKLDRDSKPGLEMSLVSRSILEYGGSVTAIDIVVAWSSVVCVSVGATLLGALGQ
jgi:hypothetical protein